MSKKLTGKERLLEALEGLVTYHEKENIKGRFRKIEDLPSYNISCRHPEHLPPTMIVLENGVYEYTCPKCNHITTVTVNKPTW